LNVAQATRKPAGTVSSPDSSGAGFMIAVAAIVVVGLAGVAYFVTTRGEGEVTREAGEQTAPVTIDGEPLLPLPSGVKVSQPETDPGLGGIAPTLTGTTFDGEEVVIGPDGSPKVIYFLAHWCPHCQAEVPIIQNLIDAGQVPEGLDIYAVSTSVDRGKGNFPASTWLEEEGFTPTVIRDDDASSALVSFGGSSFPYVVYLDAENRVVTRSSGELGRDAIDQLWQLTAAG
jgi:thiol-disulfide isomerase/thioredoxin